MPYAHRGSSAQKECKQLPCNSTPLHEDRTIMLRSCCLSMQSHTKYWTLGGGGASRGIHTTGQISIMSR